MKIALRIPCEWQRWYEAAKPRAKQMGKAISDTLPCVIFFCGGVVIAVDWLRERRGAGFIFLLCALAFLLVVTLTKNYTGRLLIEMQHRLIMAMMAELDIKLQPVPSWQSGADRRHQLSG